MFYRQAFWRLVTMIGFGFAVFLIDDKEIASHFWKIFFLLVLAALKSAYFVWLNIYILQTTSGRQFDFYKYLVFFAVSASMTVLSFSIDYFCLYRIDEAAFANIPPNAALTEQCIAFVYFSLATFSTAGFGDIYPMTTAGRIIVSLELILFLSTMVFILSNIHPLRESIINRKIKPSHEDTDRRG